MSEPIPLLVEGSTLLYGRAQGDDIGGEMIVRVRAIRALRAPNFSRLLLDVNKGISYDQQDMAYQAISHLGRIHQTGLAGRICLCAPRSCAHRIYIYKVRAIGTNGP